MNQKNVLYLNYWQSTRIRYYIIRFVLFKTYKFPPRFFIYSRAVAQRCPDPPMHNLVSIGGQHQGKNFNRCISLLERKTMVARFKKMIIYKNSMRYWLNVITISLTKLWEHLYIRHKPPSLAKYICHSVIKHLL